MPFGNSILFGCAGWNSGNAGIGIFCHGCWAEVWAEVLPQKKAARQMYRTTIAAGRMSRRGLAILVGIGSSSWAARCFFTVFTNGSLEPKSDATFFTVPLLATGRRSVEVRRQTQ